MGENMGDKVTMKELKAGARELAQFLKVSYDDAVNIIGFFSASGDWDNVRAIFAHDFKAIARGANGRGVKLSGIPVKDAFKAPESVKPAPDPLKVPKAVRGKSSPVERVAGEELQELKKGELPAGFFDTVESVLLDFRDRYNFEDLSKISEQQWRGACLYVGNYVKSIGLLHDLERERTHGGTVYDAGRVGKLIEVWEYMTTVYKHTPLRHNFFAFAGIGYEWFYMSAEKLTPERVEIIKKVVAIEEASISSGIVDSRENPTGRIYYSKARLGWQETAPRIDININNTTRSNSLPTFDD